MLERGRRAMLIAMVVAGAIGWVGAGSGRAAESAGTMKPSGSATIPPPLAAPNDLRPRPLGPARGSEAINGPAASGDKKDGTGGAGGNGGSGSVGSRSAAGALWDNPAIRTSGSLALVLGLIYGLALIAKRVAGKNGSLMAAVGAGGKAPEGVLEVLGRYPLSRGQMLILLKVDRRVLLLSQSTPRIRGGVGAVTTLCELTEPEDVASILMHVEEHEEAKAGGKSGARGGRGSNARFSALLKEFDREHATFGRDEGIEVDVSGGAEDVAAEPAAARPVVHKFPGAGVGSAPTFGAQMRAAEAYGTGAGEMGECGGMRGVETFGSIRERLHALRGEAHR